MRPRPSIAAFSLVALALFAGCVGLVDSGDGTASPSATSTATGTPASMPANATNADTVAYADLSPESKAAFEDARTGEARFLPNSSYVDGEYYDPDALDPYSDHEYVVRNGTYYTVEIISGTVYPHYDARAVITDDVPANVTHVEDLPPDAREFVRTAIEERSASTELGESLPDGLHGVEYVQRNERVYELWIAVGDYPVMQLSLKQVE